MTIAVLTFGVVLALAWANGANDVSKGVATLVGSRRATYRTGLLWGTIWTAAGALTALVLSAGLLRTFSTGLVSSSVSGHAEFPLAVAAGAAGWVALASRAGLPVSTTHALTGALVGSGIAIGGPAGVRWSILGALVVLPLAFSPVAAALIARLAQAGLRRPLTAASNVCVCIERNEITIQPLANGPAAAGVALPVLRADHVELCEPKPLARLVVADALHWTTAGILSFARAMNDNPKIIALAALGAGSAGLSGPFLFLAGAAAMTAGSLWGRRVTITLAERVTPIDAQEGLVSNATAASLVLLASIAALPVSTTHVATGAIIGAGLSGGVAAVQWRQVGTIALAWIVTLPVSALFSALAVWLLR